MCEVIQRRVGERLDYDTLSRVVRVLGVSGDHVLLEVQHDFRDPFARSHCERHELDCYQRRPRWM